MAFVGQALDRFIREVTHALACAQFVEDHERRSGQLVPEVFRVDEPAAGRRQPALLGLDEDFREARGGVIEPAGMVEQAQGRAGLARANLAVQEQRPRDLTRNQPADRFAERRLDPGNRSLLAGMPMDLRGGFQR